MALYAPIILDHYKNPRNTGKLAEFSGKADELNSSCGDQVVVYVRVVENKIAEISHETEGCAVAVASASILSERLKGEKVEEVERLREGDVRKFLGSKLTESRIKCAMLPLMAIKKALE